MEPLKHLLLNNKGSGSFMSSAVVSDSEATIYLYDAIVGSNLEADFYGGISPEDFSQLLDSIQAPVINLRVNSPGGNVFGARAMQNAIRRSQAKVIAHVDGLAASAASVLILAADEIVMGEGSFLMIHNAWTIAAGNSRDMRKQADDLEEIDASIIQSYADRTGMPAGQIKDMMEAETWIGADKAVDLGFANQKSSAISNASQTKWDLSAYANAPAKNEIKEPSQSDMTEETKPFQKEPRFDLAKAEAFQKEFLPTD